MKEEEILKLTQENLKNTSRFRIEWSEDKQKRLDALVKVFWDKNKFLSFHAAVKERVGPQHLDQIKQLSKNTADFLLVSGSLSAKVKEKLQENDISYLEANGNMFLKGKNIFLFIDIHNPLNLKGEQSNRAFTKTGLKVIFHFLIYPEWIKLSYREIANHTGASLGNVSNILNSLEDSGFLLRKSKDELIWNNRKELLDKWIAYYKERLQPTLSMGYYRFANNNLEKNWKDIRLQPDRTWWGSEPAANILTGYLNPGEWTLYTRETKLELIKKYKLVPDAKGAVRAHRAFWQFETPGHTVSPLLAYADLVNTENSRCLETAEIIYKDYLHADF
jgi:hypothetical protein